MCALPPGAHAGRHPLPAEERVRRAAAAAAAAAAAVAVALRDGRERLEQQQRGGGAVEEVRSRPADARLAPHVAEDAEEPGGGGDAQEVRRGVRVGGLGEEQPRELGPVPPAGDLEEAGRAARRPVGAEEGAAEAADEGGDAAAVVGRGFGAREERAERGRAHDAVREPVADEGAGHAHAVEEQGALRGGWGWGGGGG